MNVDDERDHDEETWQRDNAAAEARAEVEVEVEARTDELLDAAGRAALAEERRQELASEAYAQAQAFAARGLAAQAAINAAGFGPPKERAAAAEQLLARVTVPEPGEDPLPPGMSGRSLSDLAFVLGGSEDSWTGVALQLIAKSDPEHREALKRGIPMHVLAYELWYSSEDPREGIELARGLYRAMHKVVGAAFGDGRNRPGVW